MVTTDSPTPLPAPNDAGRDSGPVSPPALSCPTNLPMIYYGPTPRWRLVNWSELWQYRGLVWSLALRDLRVRYRQTLIGLTWVLLNPLATGFVFVIFFGLLGQRPAGGEIPYSLILLAGLLPWQLFASTVVSACGSLVVNQQIIGKVYFPRVILPLSVAIPNLVDFAFTLLLPVLGMLYYGVLPHWGVVLLPVLTVLAVGAALSVGIWLAALNAIYRDVGYAVPFAVQLGFFLSPVVYTTAHLIPESWRGPLSINPMVGVIEGFRWALFGGAFPAYSLAASVAVTGLTLIGGLLYFRRVEGYLADRI